MSERMIPHEGSPQDAPKPRRRGSASTAARHSVGNRRPSFDVLREQQQSTAAVPLFSGAQRGSHALSEPERGLAGVVPSLCKQGVRGSSPLGSTHFSLSDRVCPCLVAVLLVRTAESTAIQTPAICLFGPAAEQPRNFITSQIAQRKLKYAGHPWYWFCRRWPARTYC